jgi:hypothetical protein
MAVLSKIKTSNAVRADNNNDTARRRTKLIEKLNEQIQGAEALIDNKVFQLTKTVTKWTELYSELSNDVFTELCERAHS